MAFFDASKFDFASLADFTLQLMAVAYGVFATSTDFKETKEDGRKHLSKMGKIGIGFLLVNSIAGVALKVYQHRQEALGKEKAQAQQQQMIRDLELSLDATTHISSDLTKTDKRLGEQSQQMSRQTALLDKQNGAVRTIITEGERTYRQTSRLLNPIDQKIIVTVKESISTDDPVVRPYLERVHNLAPIGIAIGAQDPQWPSRVDGSFFNTFINAQWVNLELYPPQTEFITDKDGRNRWEPTMLLWSLGQCGVRPGVIASLRFVPTTLTFSCGMSVTPSLEHGTKAYGDLQNAKALIRIALPADSPDSKRLRDFQAVLGSVIVAGLNRTDSVEDIKRIPCQKPYDGQVCFSGRYRLNQEADR